MNESLAKIKNELKNFSLFKKVNPHVYWRNLLYIFFILVIGLILFSFYLLYEIKNEQIFQIVPKNTNPPSLMNEKLFKKVTESFDEKAINIKNIKDGVTTYRDPS